MSEEEDRYFQQQEQERRAAKRRELERAAHEAGERRKVAAAVATDDEALVQRLRDLGFDGDTARVIDLLPLVHVAWADGNVTTKERVSILEVLDHREIEAGSEARVLIESLLESRPSEAFLSETLDLLHNLGGGREAGILELCERVAGASGGFFGLGDKISDEERDLIRRIAGVLGADADAAFSKHS